MYAEVTLYINLSILSMINFQYSESNVISYECSIYFRVWLIPLPSSVAAWIVPLVLQMFLSLPYPEFKSSWLYKSYKKFMFFRCFKKKKKVYVFSRQHSLFILLSLNIKHCYLMFSHYIGHVWTLRRFKFEYTDVSVLQSFNN